jgi:hypothetical protein
MEQMDQALSQAGARIVDSIADFLPGALAFVALLVGAFVLALLVRYAVRRLLLGLDFDRRAEQLGLAVGDWAPARSASALAAAIAYWMIVGLGLLLGLTALDASLPSQFAVAVLQYVPHLVAALVILVAGGIVARFLARAVLIGAVNMGVEYARFLSLAVKWLVLIVAAAMALDHVGIGRTVLLLAFGLLFGGVMLAVAIAVGLGARDVVGRALDRQLREPGRPDTIDHV